MRDGCGGPASPLQMKSNALQVQWFDAENNSGTTQPAFAVVGKPYRQWRPRHDPRVRSRRRDRVRVIPWQSGHFDSQLIIHSRLRPRVSFQNLSSSWTGVPAQQDPGRTGAISVRPNLTTRRAVTQIDRRLSLQCCEGATVKALFNRSLPGLCLH